MATYVLVANTSAFNAHVRATLLFENGTTASTEMAVPANSRANFNLTPTTILTYPEFAPFFTPAEIAGLKRFAVVVESLGSPPAQIVVERAMYWSTLGQFWAAGTNIVATKLR
jgi:hypothetical protein